jgi:hypothetical protein
MRPDDSPLTTSGPGHIFTKPLGTIEVKPREEPHLSLGVFNEAISPKGFSIQVDPAPEPAGSVVTQISTLKMGKRYELVLQVTNHSDQTVHAEVWGL